MLEVAYRRQWDLFVSFLLFAVIICPVNRYSGSFCFGFRQSRYR